MWLFPWANYAALGGMAAVLIAMALMPDMQRDLKVSVLSFAVALAAFFLVNSRRRARALGSAAVQP
jgi:L-asparagine transporter-like permease